MKGRTTSRLGAMVLVLSLMTACHQISYQEQQPMQDLLNAYLSRQIPAADLTITYHIGDDFSGETYLELRGDGVYELWSTATAGRQRRSYSGQTDQAAVENLARSMIEQRLWEVQHVRSKPGEDDPLVSIQVATPANRAEVLLWISEVRQVAAFAAVQAELLDLIHSLSNHEILEGGR
ncbi:MAG: hypothetical protein K8J31_31565 [Anaerolineae bacterium]|nr:hypothetical protein [Anaerolineae bacterium]